MSLRQFQHALLADIFEAQSSSLDDSKGMVIYRNNLRANAVRAMGITFPTVKTILEEDNFSVACARYMAQHLKQQADWGLWGEHLGSFLEQQDILNSLPYLSDIARLDYVMHEGMRAKDKEINLASFNKLEELDASDLTFIFNSGFNVLRSAFPLLDIKRYFEDAVNYEQQAFDSMLADAYNAHKGSDYYIVCYRVDYEMKAGYVTSAEYHWLVSMKNSETLATALDKSNSTDFNLGSWLPKAIQEHLVIGVI